MVWEGEKTFSWKSIFVVQFGFVVNPFIIKNFNREGMLPTGIIILPFPNLDNVPQVEKYIGRLNKLLQQELAKTLCQNQMLGSL